MDAVRETSPVRRSHFWDRESVLASVMIAPAILYIAVLIGFPFVLAVLYSLSDATTGSPTLNFVGLKNFKEAVVDPVFQRSLLNTFLFTFASQGLVLVFSNILARALMKDFRGKWLVRFLILLPWTAPIALGTIGWLWMLDSIFSPFDWIFRSLGLLGAPGRVMGPMSNLYWLGGADPGDEFHHPGPYLADAPVGHRDPAGRPEQHLP